jgi:hypothetical protein
LDLEEKLKALKMILKPPVPAPTSGGDPQTFN